MPLPPQDLAQVIGANVRRLRDELTLTQDELARRARGLGLRWDRSTVAKIELGERSPTLAEFLCLPLILRASLQDLVGGQHWVGLTEETSLSAKAIQALVQGESGDSVSSHSIRYTEGEALERIEEGQDDFLSIEDLTLQYGAMWGGAIPAIEILDANEDARQEAEQKAARKLGEDAIGIALVARKLWGRGLTAERDQRVAKRVSGDQSERSIQAARGHVTRDLVRDIENALSEGSSDD